MLKLIDKILDQIPHDFDLKLPLIQRLKSIQNSYSYASPEMQHHLRREVSLTLNLFLKEIDSEWKMEISNIMTKKSLLL